MTVDWDDRWLAALNPHTTPNNFFFYRKEYKSPIRYLDDETGPIVASETLKSVLSDKNKKKIN